MKKGTTYLRISDKEFIMYAIVEKGSNSGLFKNNRLLIFNAKNESLCYLSKVPSGIIPFLSYEEVLSQQPKEKLLRSEVFENGENRFSCR